MGNENGLTVLQARAVFCGWNPDANGPVDEASDKALVAYTSRGVFGTFSVNGEEPISAHDLIGANLHDPAVLAEAGALQIGESAGGGAGGDVRRIS